MDKIFKQSLLYDFYGELLTNHQKRIFEDFVLNDLSLSEIALEQGISRQGVHDNIKRSNKILEDYESKLHLVERFIKTKKDVEKICILADKISEFDSEESKEAIEQIKRLASDISSNM
ncbi:MAG: YlxM family DNA-binding protein [Eubacterium sp.]